jgi:hypothetical protein
MVRRRILRIVIVVSSSVHGTSSFAPTTTTTTTQTTTQLRVAELFVPGYATTKLPFLLTQDEQASIIPILPNPDDFEKYIPFQDGHLLYRSKIPIFSDAECKAIIDEAEAVASQMAWTTNRHGNFPTTDLPLVELSDSLQFLKRILVERIYPILRQQFETYLPDPFALRVADGFVVKYDAENGQTELKPHRDGSVLSFNIALNDPTVDFEGGGTWFASTDTSYSPPKGGIVSHASCLLHGGHTITRGMRYILVAFVIMEGYDTWSLRFYNQARNL